MTSDVHPALKLSNSLTQLPQHQAHGALKVRCTSPGPQAFAAWAACWTPRCFLAPPTQDLGHTYRLA